MDGKPKQYQYNGNALKKHRLIRSILICYPAYRIPPYNTTIRQSDWDKCATRIAMPQIESDFGA